MKRFIPRVGSVWDSRQELEDRLLKSGWAFEGSGASLKKGKIVEVDLGMEDESKDVWLRVFARPIEGLPEGRIKVTKVIKKKLGGDSSKGRS